VESIDALRTVRRALFLLTFLILAGSLTSCGRVQRPAPSSQDGFTVTLATEPAPPIVGTGLVSVRLEDRAGTPVTDARLALEANMTHAGMAPVLGQASASPDGRYRVPIEWTMAGDWYVDIAFSLPDGQTVTRRFALGVR
jgi:hypothetical protein